MYRARCRKAKEQLDGDGEEEEEEMLEKPMLVKLHEINIFRRKARQRYV